MQDTVSGCLWCPLLWLMLTSSNLAHVFPRQEVLEQVAQELQRNVLEGEGRPVEQLKQVQVVLEVSQGCDLVMSEGGVTLVDDGLEVLRGYLGGRDVQRQDVVGELGEGQVFPVLPVGGGGDLLGDIEATVVGETLEDDVFEGELSTGTSVGPSRQAARNCVFRRAGESYVFVLATGAQVPLGGGVGAIGGRLGGFAVGHGGCQK